MWSRCYLLGSSWAQAGLQWGSFSDEAACAGRSQVLRRRRSRWCNGSDRRQPARVIFQRQWFAWFGRALQCSIQAGRLGCEMISDLAALKCFVALVSQAKAKPLGQEKPSEDCIRCHEECALFTCRFFLSSICPLNDAIAQLWKRRGLTLN